MTAMTEDFGDIYSFHSYSMISDQIQSSSMLDVTYLVICGILYIAPTICVHSIPNSIWRRFDSYL